MKLFSTNRNSKGKQLVCDDAVFDPNLIMTLHADADEKVVTFQYDFEECGHPLNLPFDVQSVSFLVKFTKHDIHICAIAEASDEMDEQYDEFIGGIGDEIEFDVRMSVEEKYALLLSLFNPLLSMVKTKEKSPTPNVAPNKADAKTLKKEYPFDDNTFKAAMAELFTNIFNGSNLENKK